MEKKPSRNWPELREWANFAVAGAALLVSIVSFWTTTRVSGLEDYLRSEIERRNVELNDATANAQVLDRRVQNSTDRLEELRSNTNELIVSSAKAQATLAAAQARSIDLLADQRSTAQALDAARKNLANVGKEIEQKQASLERYRQEEVLSRVHASIRFRTLNLAVATANGEPQRPYDGPTALEDIRNFGLGVTDPNLIGFYEAIRSKAPRICRHLETFSPEFPSAIETPKFDRTGLEGRVPFWLLDKRQREWQERFRAWDEAWTQASNFNRSIRDARRASREFVSGSLNHCTCVAIRGISDGCTEMPERPNIVEIIGSKP